jgi:hypothetical protein
MAFSIYLRPYKSKKKKRQIGDHDLPQWGFGLGTPKGRKQCGQHRATRDEGCNERGRQKLCTRPAANTCSHVHQQVLPHKQQTPQSKGHKRQEASIQQQKQSEDKRTRSRKVPGATACKSGRQPQGQKIQHAAPGARAQPRQRHQTRHPKDQATNE